jgi:hypothetical protein
MRLQGVAGAFVPKNGCGHARRAAGWRYSVVFVGIRRLLAGF